MNLKDSNTMHRYQNSIMFLLYAGVLIAGYGILTISKKELTVGGLTELRLYFLASLISFFIAVIAVRLFCSFLTKMEKRPLDLDDNNDTNPLSPE